RRAITQSLDEILQVFRPQSLRLSTPRPGERQGTPLGKLGEERSELRVDLKVASRALLGHLIQDRACEVCWIEARHDAREPAQSTVEGIEMLIDECIVLEDAHQLGRDLFLADGLPGGLRSPAGKRGPIGVA